jgi:TRAP-type C4-dicarboxylate transport system permease small subunit
LIRLINKLSYGAGLVAAIFLVAMTVHITIDVIWEHIFNKPIEGTLEIVSLYYMVGLVFLALAYVEQKDAHISADLVFMLLPAPAKIVAYAFGVLAALLYFGLLTYQTALDAWYATENHETAMANFVFYIWPAKWMIPIGSGLMFAIVAIKAGYAIKNLTFTGQGDTHV